MYSPTKLDLKDKEEGALMTSCGNFVFCFYFFFLLFNKIQVFTSTLFSSINQLHTTFLKSCFIQKWPLVVVILNDRYLSQSAAVFYRRPLRCFREGVDTCQEGLARTDEESVSVQAPKYQEISWI